MRAPELPAFSELHMRLTKDRNWMLTQPLFYFHKAGQTLVVPPKFRTDLDSVPRVPVV